MQTSTSTQQRTPPIRQFQGEAVVYIPLAELHPFPDQPFKIRDDKAMQETVESVREYGVLTPAIVRPRESGGYEIVSGHRRRHACELAGADALPAIVREMDDDTAIILLVDSNIQREEILPSERAQALKMKLDAIRRKAGRPSKENCDQVGYNFYGKRSVEIIAEQSGESKTQVQRYIRLTNLLPELLAMVDEKQLAFNTAVELSCLMPDEQNRVLEMIENGQAAPSLTQAQQMKKLSQAGELNLSAIRSIMEGEKNPPTAVPTPTVPPELKAVPDTSARPAPATAKAPSAPPQPPEAEPAAAPSTPAVPFDLGDKQYANFAESIADLKNNDKDCSCTPDQFLAEFTGFVRKFHKEINWFHISYYEVIFPALSPVQMDYLRQQMDEICAAVDKLYDHVKGK